MTSLTPTTLLLIVGPGRSGTSTLAGSLSKLGAHVAGPYLNANASNPMGFFESSWSVAFHNTILKRGSVSLADARPEAPELAEKAVTAAERDALKNYLIEQAQDRDLVVLKDPRIVWLLSTFTSVAAELNMSLAAAVMVRRPAEVIASRLTYYHNEDAELEALGYQARDLAGWVNQLTTCESLIRDLPHAFVSYDELLTDWRSAVTRALRHLPVSLPVPDADEHHPVDDFINPGLNRHQREWPSMSAKLEQLRSLADQAFDACDALARHTKDAENATAQLDQVRARYADFYEIDRAIAHDEVLAARAAAEAFLAEQAEIAETAAALALEQSAPPLAVAQLPRIWAGVKRRARRAVRR